MWCYTVDWIQLSQDGVLGLAVVNTVMTFGFHEG